MPRGKQFASTLVNGLLQGPQPSSDRSSNFLPPGLGRGLGAGLGQRRRAGRPDQRHRRGRPRPRRTSRAVRLPAGLDAAPGPDDRAVPGVHRRPAGAAAGGGGVQRRARPRVRAVRRRVEHPALRAAGRPDGRQAARRTSTPVTGPFGQGATGCARSPPTCAADQVAGVSATGPRCGWRRSRTPAEPATTLIGERRGPAPTGLGLHRPAVGGGPAQGRGRRQLPAQRTDAPLEVSGISGADVKDFLVSRDGTRLDRRGPQGRRATTRSW